MPTTKRCAMTVGLLWLLIAACVHGEEDDPVRWDPERVIGKTQRMGMALNNADAIAADEHGRVHIVWHNVVDVGATTPTQEIHYLRLQDHGALPSEVRLLTKSGKRSASAGVSVGPDDIVDVVWGEAGEEGETLVSHLRSDDGGDTWSEVHRVAACRGGPVAAPYTDEKGRIHVVWQDQIRRRYHHSYYASSSDGGKTWSEPVPIHNNPDEASQFPSIDGGEDKILFVYRAGNRPQIQVYFRALDPDSGKMSEPVMVSDGEMRSWDPTIAVDDSGSLHVVYQRAGVATPETPPDSAKGGFAKGKGKGKFEGPPFAAKSKALGKGQPLGEAGGAGAPGQRFDPSDPRVYYARSDDGGETWTRSRLGERHSRFARIDAAKGNRLAVFWEDGPLGSRDAGGDIWDPKEGKWIGNFSANTADADASFAQADLDDQGWLHVLWNDRRSGEQEIYYRRARVFVEP